MSLLLTFFILLSFATMEKIKYKVLLGPSRRLLVCRRSSHVYSPAVPKGIAKEFR